MPYFDYNLLKEVDRMMLLITGTISNYRFTSSYTVPINVDNIVSKQTHTHIYIYVCVRLLTILSTLMGTV